MSDIAQKIAKLIAKADSSTHPEEADAFMSKAHAMLEAHGLSLLDLGTLDSDDAVGKTDNAMLSSDGGKDKIAFPLAAYYGCELVIAHAPGTRSTKRYVLFGRESARVTFQLMAPFVFRQVARMALVEQKSGAYSTPAKARTALAGALAMRLYRLTAANEARPQGSGLNALVPVDIIRQARDLAFPKATPSRMKHDHDYNAQEVAKRVSLNQQAPAPKGALRIESK